MQVQLLDQLESFVRAVDHVSPEVEHKVRDTIAAYIGIDRKQNGGDSRLNYEILIQESSTRGDEGSRLLNPRWSSYVNPKSRNIPLPRPGEPYKGHAEYCFDKGCDIWIYAKNGGLLRETTIYENMYTNQDLPQYRDYPGEDSRVSIVKPIRDQVDERRVLGVLTIECWDRLEYSNGAHNVLEQLGRIISLLIRSERRSRLNSENTLTAAGELLERAGKPGTFARLCQRPIIFHAHSSRARKDALGIIRAAVEGLSATHKARHSLSFDYRTWQDSIKPTDIVPELLDTLGESVVGIAYVSEPAESAADRFSDNPNVLYEVGIMHGLGMGAPFRGCLLIREAKSISDLPFDLRQKRWITIERGRNNAIINRKLIESQIQRALSDLLEKHL